VALCTTTIRLSQLVLQDLLRLQKNVNTPFLTCSVSACHSKATIVRGANGGRNEAYTWKKKQCEGYTERKRQRYEYCVYSGVKVFRQVLYRPVIQVSNIINLTYAAMHSDDTKVRYSIIIYENEFP